MTQFNFSAARIVSLNAIGKVDADEKGQSSFWLSFSNLYVFNAHTVFVGFAQQILFGTHSLDYLVARGSVCRSTFSPTGAIFHQNNMNKNDLGSGSL